MPVAVCHGSGLRVSHRNQRAEISRHVIVWDILQRRRLVGRYVVFAFLPDVSGIVH